jgi:hypothetical protein
LLTGVGVSSYNSYGLGFEEGLKLRNRSHLSFRMGQRIA